MTPNHPSSKYSVLILRPNSLGQVKQHGDFDFGRLRRQLHYPRFGNLSEDEFRKPAKDDLQSAGKTDNKHINILLDGCRK